jgi:hypothetical protein
MGRKVGVSQLSPGGHADLPEGVAEMPLDRTGAQEQAPADLSVGKPALDQLDDLQLLTGELCRRGVNVSACSSPRGCRQFAPSSFGEGADAHFGQGIMGDRQLVVGLTFAAFST